MRPGIIPLRPLGLGDILDGAIKLMRSNPKSVLGLSAIAAALSAIPVAIGQALMLSSTASFLENPTETANLPEASFLSQYGGTLLSYALQLVAVTLLTGVLTRILGRAVFGGKMTAGEAWTLTRSRVPTLFGLVIVSTVALLAPMLLIVGLFATLDAAGAGPAMVVIAGVSALPAFVAYALFITTRLALAPRPRYWSGAASSTPCAGHGTWSPAASGGRSASCCSPRSSPPWSARCSPSRSPSAGASSPSWAGAPPVRRSPRRSSSPWASPSAR